MREKENYKRRISPRFLEEDYETIILVAAQNNKTPTEWLRDVALKELRGDVTRNNIDFVSKIIREQIKDIIKPEMNRISALQAKTCIMAASSNYLTAEAISKFVPINARADFQEVYELSRKKAVMYTKSNLNKIEDGE